MSLPIEFDRDAHDEFVASAAWYDSRRSGLGLEFVEEVEAVLRLIEQSPHTFAEVENGIRQVTVKRFPFSVIYRAETNRILVLAVFHGSRDHDAWKGRLQ